MGGHYGSIHIRTDDRTSVLTAVKAVAKSKSIEFLVAPILRGWTTVYPSMNGQDESVSKALAKKLPYDVVHVLVHDDDIFCYWVYRGGKLLDEFNSNPDYFEEVTQRKKARLAGKPEKFADLIWDGGTIAMLEEAIRGRRMSASDHLLRFAELLDLPNALTAFEYLLSGETEDIEEFSRFERIPQVSASDLRQEQLREAFEAQRQRLKDEGCLLAEWTAHIQWCLNPSGGILLTCRDENDRLWEVAAPLLCWKSPWNSARPLFDLQFDRPLYEFQLNPHGEHLAVRYRDGAREVQLRHLPTHESIGEAPASRGCQAMTFSSDGRLLALGVEHRLEILDTRDGRVAASIAVPIERAIQFHPSGGFLVAGHANGIAIIDYRRARLRKILRVGSPESDTAASDLESKAREDLPLQNENLNKMLRQVKKAVTGSMPQLKALVGVHEALRAVNASLSLASGNTVEQVCQIKFSADGRSLFLATQAGIRAYAWHDMQKAEEWTPSPYAFANAEPVAEERASGFPSMASYTYDLAIDEQAGLALFCGLEGKIRAVRLSDGHALDLTPRLGTGGIFRIELSPDRSILYTHAQLTSMQRGETPPSTLHIWDYQRLLRSAGC